MDHIITLTPQQEKALKIKTDAFNDPLLSQIPPGNIQTPDQILQGLLNPALDSMIVESNAIIEAPLAEKLHQFVATGDDAALAIIQAIPVKPLQPVQSNDVPQAEALTESDALAAPVEALVEAAPAADLVKPSMLTRLRNRFRRKK